MSFGLNGSTYERLKENRAEIYIIMKTDNIGMS